MRISLYRLSLLVIIGGTLGVVAWGGFRLMEARHSVDEVSVQAASAHGYGSDPDPQVLQIADDTRALGTTSAADRFMENTSTALFAGMILLFGSTMTVVCVSTRNRR